MPIHAEKLCCESYAINPSEASHLQYDLFRLMRTFYAVSREMVNVPGITALQGYVLMGLQIEGPMTMSKISDYTKLSLSTMTRVVDKLVEFGLVERVRNESDRRVVLLRLTQTGQAKSTTLRLLQNVFFERLLSDLSEIERQDVLSGLAILINRLEEVSQDQAGRSAMSNANVDEGFVEASAMHA